MDTVSRRLKDVVRSAMQEDKIYNNEEIRQLIYEKTGMRYKEEDRETHFAGCLSALKKSGGIIQVERGKYRKGNVRTGLLNSNMSDQESKKFPEIMPENETFILQVKKEISQSVKRELSCLKAVTKKIVLPFDTSEEDLQYMLKVKELIRNLEEFER